MTRASSLFGLLTSKLVVMSPEEGVTCDPDLRPVQDLLDAADLLVVAAPHPEYAALRTDKPVADIWNIQGAGVRI